MFQSPLHAVLSNEYQFPNNDSRRPVFNSVNRLLQMRLEKLKSSIAFSNIKIHNIRFSNS